MSEIKEPTSEQCEKREVLWREGQTFAWATFSYPQMGGYCAKAVVVAHENSNANDCFDIYIWHNSEFPFGSKEGQKPVEIHHCDAEQFVDFGNEVMRMVESLATSKEDGRKGE